ncbi:hypothetical protein ZWY2020_009428 [Hordeum vulgare]|nr:hypothetical protein ZWY2020_009428 [Hordeum vulgare]
MANFTCNLFAFLSSGFSIEQGPADRKVPTIIRGPFGIQNPPMPLHLIAWNPQYEEVNFLLSPVAPARKGPESYDNSEGVEFTHSAMSVDLHVSASRKRGRKPKPNTPLCTTEVRRSPHSNKYVGFKVDQLDDACGRKSLIKPRMSMVISDPTPSSCDEDASSSSAPPPPPMIIKDIQQVGTGLCGIPPEELTDECLLAKGKDEEEQ